MSFFATLFSISNLVLVPAYCFYRFKKNNYFILFNPGFYLLVASYLYLIPSSIFLSQYIQWINISYYSEFKPESLQFTSILCNWYVLVFLFFYIKSTDWISVPRENYKPKAITYNIALLLTVLLSVYFFYILAKYGAVLFSSDRFEALEFYTRTILLRHKVLILLPIFLSSLATVIWQTKKARWFLVVLIPVLTEFLARGRTRSLMIVVFSYINYIAIFRKTFAKYLIVLLLSYTIFIPIYRSYEGFAGFQLIAESPQILLFRGLAEIFATRITTVIAYEELMYSEDFYIYLTASFLRLFPFFIYKFFLGDNIDITQINYIEMMKIYYAQHYDIDWGLAGNIVTEALVYGGIELAFLSPIIIGLIFWGLNQVKIQQTFPGFIFLCLLISQLQRIIRSSFFDSFFVLIYTMFIYLGWIVVLERGRKVLVVTRNKNG
ncbi:MAG: hypothetical protein SW833_15920 [Cyanobacteriota bacterium]|nr:hypothetical protein [Cyanobacteriota bacterium]